MFFDIRKLGISKCVHIHANQSRYHIINAVCVFNKRIYLFYVVSDKVEDVRIDLDDKKVYVTSTELSADQILEAIKRTGKTTRYIGVAN